MNVNPQSNDFVLEPADNKRLANLCGQFNEHLRQVEHCLGVEINQRGNSFYVIGDEAPVRAAKEVIKNLYAEAANAALTPAQVHLFLQNIADEADAAGKAEDVSTDEVVVTTPRGKIKGRNTRQRIYLNNIGHYDINFGIGPAGTGKTYLAVACAVEALEKESVTRLVLTRPAVEAGERLGFLPGDLVQKIDPYLRPLYDALYEMFGYEYVAKLMERNAIEIAPLAYMRGRTLNDSFIILDEAQNTTIEQMKMFLTRIGFNSQVIITGDITQIDLPRERPSGLRHIIEVLGDVEGIGFTFFQAKDVVRHPLVQRIVYAYEAHAAKTADENEAG